VRACGFLPDPPKAEGERPDFDAGVLVARATPSPPSHDLMPLVVEVLDQGGLGSCVAQAATQAIRMRDRAALGPASVPPLGSRLFAYYASRAHHHAQAYDTGTNYRSMFSGLARFGLPPESTWPYDDSARPGARFAKMPATDAFRLAADARRRIEYLRVYDAGYARVEVVKSAIAAGHPVCFGLDVTEAFMDEAFDPTAPLPPLDGTPVGGHAMLLAGYDGDSFRCLNSWGRSWADGGTCLLSADLVIAQARDLWIVIAGAAA
jgi:C1A family cysteine protease